MVNSCWFAFKLSLGAAIVAGLVAAFCLYRRMDDEIRLRVEKRIAEHYVGLKVSLRSAQLVEGKGIRVQDLSIAEPGAEGPRAEILHIDEALLECPTDWQELLKGDPAIHRITVRRPVLRVTRRPDGGWSAGKLLPPPPHFGDHSPEMAVENGSIEVFDPLHVPTSSLSLRDVNLTLVPVPPNQPGATPGARRLQGMLAADGVRCVEFEGVVDMQAARGSVRGQAQAVELSPELRGSLPQPLVARLAALGELRGQADVRFQVSYDPAAAMPLKYEVAGRLARGRIDDARLPHALTDIRAGFRVDNGGFAIEDLFARSGQATLRMSCRRSGFSETSPLQLTAEVRQMELDRALLNILPPALQDQWHKYRPAGEFDADIKLSFDGEVWRPDLAVRCLNVSFTHHKFPYRMEHGKGTVDVKDDRLTMNMTAFAGAQPVRLTGEFAQPFHQPIGWFEAKGDALQLDESLMLALPEKPREVVRSLDPRGTVAFYIRLWREKPDEPMHQHLWIAANHCSIRYTKFPYPLSNIRGTLEMLDGNWTFRDLDGTNDTARVACEGRLTHGPQGSELVLMLSGRDVPLEDSLHTALSPNIRQVWDDLRPRGKIDVAAEVRYLAEEKKFSVAAQVQPQPETASINPSRFPYRLDRLQGVVTYRDGHVTFEQCKGEHGAVKVAAAGTCDVRPDGRWQVHFAQLSADRLRADRELIQALPERLRKAVVELNPTGSVNLRGSFDLERVGGPAELLRSAWNVRLGVQQSDVQFGGMLLQNLHGEVALRGGFDGQQLRSRGELALDSLGYKDYQLTQVVGPIWIDDGRVLFGHWVDRQENMPANSPAGPAQPPRPVVANLFGGKLYGDGWLTLGRESRYAVNATLADADLPRCAKELGTGRQNLRGKILATADLTGSGRTRNALAGRGTIRLSEADVYELPVMISLLKILSIRSPDQNAFSDATVDYRIEGEHVYFDRIDFHGDAISLRGKGEMDFQSAVRMTFYATVGRGELDLPVIKQVFSGAAQQIMLIHVDGTLQNPETRKEALPAVNQALQQLRDELQNRK